MPEQKNFISDLQKNENEKLFKKIKDRELAIENERLALQDEYHEAKFSEEDEDLKTRITKLSTKSGTFIHPTDIIAAINRHIESRHKKDPVYISNQTPQSIAITELNSINNNLDVEEKHELHEIINEILIRNKFVPRESPNAKMLPFTPKREY